MDNNRKSDMDTWIDIVLISIVVVLALCMAVVLSGCSSPSTEFPVVEMHEPVIVDHVDNLIHYDHGRDTTAHLKGVWVTDPTE